MNRIASFHLRAATIYALIGMCWGIHMAISQDHSLFPAHAHLNLLGWVSVFLYGLFFAHRPAAADGLLPKIHLVLAHLGLIIMIPGVALLLSGVEVGEKMAALGSILTVLSMLLFSVMVFRATAKA
jgi:hypothetical protein